MPHDSDVLPRILPPADDIDSNIASADAIIDRAIPGHDDETRKRRIAIRRVTHACILAEAAINTAGSGLHDYLLERPGPDGKEFAWWFGLEAQNAVNALRIAALEIEKSIPIVRADAAGPTA